eukprot:CAMPEP_0181443088 /NCGR_PEP_ID=MMETSP1110-20121109/24373_1 /TAXON_ID=174948 /ORGANISM="Symbiodinium sp., Strain CCMP421" /LENGTH=803 /DNA_ID=CAMNT_0023567053 /DNA_START=41 /DNA_END=2452 /DNA_ORIENTATION=-
MRPFLACGLVLANGARHNLAPHAAAIEAQILKAADHVDPTVRYDEEWFESHCDLSEFSQDMLFLGPEFRLSKRPTVDAHRWHPGYKCTEDGAGRAPEFVEISEEFQCAERCWETARKVPGTVVCCEHHQDKSRCEVRVGWQSMQESDYGKNKLNPANWALFGRHQKKARLFFSPPSTHENHRYVPQFESEEVRQAESGKQHVRELARQVNHLSIDGILDHMLSFYVCMRFLPDKDFMDLAKYELERVAVDQDTPVAGHDVSREEIYQEFKNAHLFPLRCGRSMHVQDIEAIDQLVQTLNDSSSLLNEAYRFSVNVTEKAGKSLHEMDKEMRLNESDPERPDSIYVQDMRWTARQSLPWSTFLRPSKHYEHHVSRHPKNLFMLCFGPRVASYPHKRENGEHILADMNTAGCNGFWDLEEVIRHMDRIKKLFAPEMCFEFKLRKELKLKFMQTFVEMNQQFEASMTGNYFTQVHEMDNTGSTRLELLSDRSNLSTKAINFMDSRKVQQKYDRFSQLMAKAHSKWVICGAHDQVGPEAFGTEDNFFRNPTAYDKWLGSIADENMMECKTLDETTGCVKCAIAVKDEHGCRIRLDVKLKDIYQAASGAAYPFLQSDYKVHEEVTDETGHKDMVTRNKKGLCMVRKNPTSMRAAIRDSRHLSEAERKAAAAKAFFHVSKDDQVVMLESLDELNNRIEGNSGKPVVSDYRYTIEERQEEKLKFEENATGEVLEEDFRILADALGATKYTDSLKDFPQKFVFTDQIRQDQNRPAHRVDYIVSCPCSPGDFSLLNYFQEVGSQGMSEYYNR